MDTEKKNTEQKKKGKSISFRSIIVPAIIVVLVLHAIIVQNTIHINRQGQVISTAMQTNFQFNARAKTLERSGDALTDHARLFLSTGERSYLDNFFTNLEALRHTDLSFQSNLLSPDTVSTIETEMEAAFRSIEARAAMDIRAMCLGAQAMGIDVSAYPEMVKTSVSAAEAALTSTTLKTKAGELMSSPEYVMIKDEIHQHIDLAVQTASMSTTAMIQQESARLERLRNLQWVVMIIIILFLSCICVLLFVLMVTPLEKSVAMVQNGETIPENRGLSELRRLAGSYNQLLHHRNELEDDLRGLSTTDALTGLLNRLAYKELLSRLERNRGDAAVTIFSMDVNGLKETNDRYGHLSGDQLLISSARCIKDCFGDAEGNNCFRLGGDEFAAVCLDMDETACDAALDRFTAEQKKKNISVSVGYAHAGRLDEADLEALYADADQSMYRNKTDTDHGRAAAQA